MVLPWPPGSNTWRPCPVCGTPWRPWALSLLPCHAVCLYTPEEQDNLLALSSRMTERLLAAQLGVTTGILRSNLHAAMIRRRRRVAR
jgi:hypothetical protein